MLCRTRVRIMVVGQEVLFDPQRLFNHIQKLSFTFMTADLRERCCPYNKHVNSLDLLTNGIINVVTDVFTLIVALAFMFSIHFGLLNYPYTVPLMVLVIFMLKRTIGVRWQTVRKRYRI